MNRPLTALVLFFLPLLGCDSGTGPSREIEAALSVSPVSGDTDTDFVFNAGGSLSTGKAPSWEFRWDWNGDGVWDKDWSSASSQTHRFDTPGNRTVNVEARDRESSDVATALVDVLSVVVVELEVSPEEGTVLTDFEFDAGSSVSSTPGVVDFQYRWDWDSDGSWDTDWSDESTVEERFSDSDNPQVTVEVRDGQATATASISLSVNRNHGAVVDSILMDPAISPSGLAYDGEHFWFSQWGPGESLVQMSSETGEILKSFPAHSNWTGSLTWDGTHLWQMTFGATPILLQIDPDDGAFVGDIEVIYSKASGGLSWDGDGFFYGSRRNVNSGGDNRIHRYGNAGNELQVLDVPAGTDEPLGLAFDGRDLWVLATGSDEVYVMDPASGAIVRSFPLQGRAFIEITGGYLWTFDSPGGTRLLRKIVP